MKILVHYVAFHPDNYQGGSGKSFEFRKLVEVPEGTLSQAVENYIGQAIAEQARQQTAYNDVYDFKVAIQKMELL